jgi:nucleoside-diphosphate-sugar epimerase
MRVLIIGGTGFIGPHVIAALHRSGHEVTVYHRGDHEPDLPSAVRHIHSPRAGIPVLHFPPGLTDPPPDIVLHMFPVGEDDTRAALARFSGVARRLVAISSGDVYLAYGRLLGTETGPPEPVPLAEGAALRSRLYPYRHTAAGPADWTFHYEKILVERAVLSQSAPAGTVLRLPAVYGPGDPYRRLRPYIKRMDDLRPAVLLESAQMVWRWTHGYVENVAQAIALAVIADQTAGQVYNVGEDETPAMAERVREIGTVMGWSGSVIAVDPEQLPAHLRAPYRPTQDLVLDTRKLREELGYAEAVSSREGLRKTIEWERLNPPAVGDPGPLEYAAEDAAIARA